jgi:hypothetical protein
MLSSRRLCQLSYNDDCTQRKTVQTWTQLREPGECQYYRAQKNSHRTDCEGPYGARAEAVSISRLDQWPQAGWHCMGTRGATQAEDVQAIELTKGIFLKTSPLCKGCFHLMDHAACRSYIYSEIIALNSSICLCWSSSLSRTDFKAAWRKADTLS